jgi:hypothetical protein
VREAVLTNLWLTALNQLQPTYVRCPEGKPSWLPDCLLDQGRNVAEYLAVPSRDARVIASAGVESSVCWIYGWTRRLTVPAGACTHACIAAAQGDTMEACVHRMLYRSAVQSSVDEFRSQDFGPKAELGSTHGIGLGILFCLQNGTLIRPASTRFVIDCSRTPVPRNRFVQVGVYGGGWIYGGG